MWDDPTPTLKELDDEHLLMEDDDPHLMLNASKAPGNETIANCWGNEESVWYEDEKKVNKSLLPDFNSSIWDDAEVNQSMNDPHIMLNASKAPGNDTIAGAFRNQETVWEDCQENSMTLSSNKSTVRNANWTIWEVNDAEEVSFDLTRFNFGEEDVIEAQRRTRSSVLGFTAPCCLTFVEHRNIALVSEPQFDRIGVYNSDNFRFKCWLENPDEEKGYTFNNPTSILSPSDGYIVVIEKEKLHVLNRGFAKQSSIIGNYHGLTEDKESGGIWTIIEKDRIIVARHFKINPKTRFC